MHIQAFVNDLLFQYMEFRECEVNDKLATLLVQFSSSLSSFLFFFQHSVLPSFNAHQLMFDCNCE